MSYLPSLTAIVYHLTYNLRCDSSEISIPSGDIMFSKKFVIKFEINRDRDIPEMKVDPTDNIGQVYSSQMGLLAYLLCGSLYIVNLIDCV